MYLYKNKNMFPTISSLSEYLFGTPVSIPIPTFGVFVALAFVLSYLTVLSEFKRKEKEGRIKPWQKTVKAGEGASLPDYLEYGFLGFLLGFKVIGALVYYQQFSLGPLKFIFSLHGSWSAGFLLCITFSGLIYWQKKQELIRPTPATTVIFHPYQLMPKLIIWAALWGFLGAKVFNFLEHIQVYSSYSFTDFLKYSGLTFLGGLTFGAISYLYIGYKNGMKLIHLADIGSPGMLVAYGVGRIGCQLSGDGDWGIINRYPKPFAWLPDWMWSFRFPHNVLNEGVYIQGCSGNYCSVLSDPVYPTSFYESVIILGCFSVLWGLRRKIQLPGLMFCFFLLIMGAERFLMEEIKLNFKYEIFGLHLSEAQIVSLCFLLLSLLIAANIFVNKKGRPF